MECIISIFFPHISPEEELFFYAVICVESHQTSSPVLFRVLWYNRHLDLHSPTFYFLRSFLMLFSSTISINKILPVGLHYLSECRSSLCGSV